MDDIKKYFIMPEATLRDAIENIGQGKIGITLVVDGDHRLLGSITDGDVRRGLLRGLQLSESVEGIVNRNCTYCEVGDPREKIVETGRAKILQQIPIVDANRKVVRIDIVSGVPEVQNRENRVFLMAGGLGRRLMPLTSKTPKPMLSIGDEPILKRIIFEFKKYGFTNFTICVNHLAELIESHFHDGRDLGVNITYIKEAKKLGTAGALSLIDFEITNPFVVMNADLITNVNFDQLISFHYQHNASATMCVKEYRVNIPYGVVSVDGCTVTGIEEKPIQKFFINAGIYVFEPQVLNLIPKNEYFDMTHLLKRLLGSKREVSLFPIYEYWIDIGQPRDFETANDTFKN